MSARRKMCTIVRISNFIFDIIKKVITTKMIMIQSCRRSKELDNEFYLLVPKPLGQKTNFAIEYPR